MKVLPTFALCLLMLIGSSVQAAVTGTGDISHPLTAGAIKLTNFRIGDETDGSLFIDAGSVFETSYSYIGYSPNANGQATISGAGSAWKMQGGLAIISGSNDTFCIGYEGHGILNITDGGAVEVKHNASLGYKFNSTGIVTVEGAGSIWSCSNDLFVGETGTGTLNILNQGLVEIGGTTSVGNNSEIHFDNGTLSTRELIAQSEQLTGTGTINLTKVVHDNVDVTIDSADDLIQTTLLNSQSGQNITVNYDMICPGEVIVGNHGNASLAITNGMEVASEDIYFGYNAGSNGTGTVSGENSAWNVSDSLYVGYGGTGRLNVTDGGTLHSGLSYIAREAGSTGTVTISGAESNWELSNLSVGHEGSGTLNIMDGAIVSVINSSGYGGNILGSRAGSSGSVNVSGTGSTWNCGYVLFIGFDGNGELNITNGGTVNCTKNTYNGYGIALQAGSKGKVTVSGTNSTWNIGSNLFFEKGEGELHITDGGTVNVNNTTFVKIFDNSDDAETIHFNGGTLNTGSLLAGSNQLTGTGTINTKGILADGIDLTFNANQGLQQTFYLTGEEKNIEVNLDCDQPEYMGAGFLEHGTLTIQDELAIQSGYGYLGYQVGSDGEATISGTGSTWKIATPNSLASNLYVGYRGNGQLNLLDGGAVSVQDETHLAYLEGASGSIHFDGGILTTTAFYGGANQMTGTGTINTNGIVTDGADLVFDATNGSQQTFTIGGSGKNITVNLNQSDTEVLGVGYTGSGSITIQEGATINSNKSYLGYRTGTTGTATVSGNGSTWNAGDLMVGYQGDGHLYIVNGGTVTGRGEVGYDTGTTGTVTVSGVGSTWNNYKTNIGYRGNGTLNIINGGTVIEREGTILGWCTGSSGTVNVSGVGSTWKTSLGDSLLDSLLIGFQGEGHLNITNGGTVISYCSNIASSSDPNSSGFVTVSDLGSTWINSSLFLEGAYASIVSIINGGLVKVDSLEICGNETGPSFINLSTGGMLALLGEADASLEAFLDLISGTDAIRWWDESIGDWAPITTADLGTDYTLDYINEGDLDGYTVLTVGTVPEPGAVTLLLSTLLAMGFASLSRKHVARYSSRR